MRARSYRLGLLMMSVVIAGCGGASTPLAPERSFEGTWSGVTEQATPFAFTVTNGSITTVRFSAAVTTEQCGGTITGGADGTRPLGFVSGRQFSALGAVSTGALIWSVDGTFPSAAAAAGTLQVRVAPPLTGSSGCVASATLGWSATKD